MNEVKTKLIGVGEVAQRLGVSIRTIRTYVSKKLMPPPIRLAGVIRWKESDINQWIASGCPSQK